MKTPSFNYQHATTPQQMDEVFRLRYACYHGKGAIEARDDERFQDSYDQLPDHFSFLLNTPEECALATVRISVMRPDLPNWDVCPSLKVFGDHPAFQQIAKSSFVEASRLCFAEQARATFCMDW